MPSKPAKRSATPKKARAAKSSTAATKPPTSAKPAATKTAAAKPPSHKAPAKRPTPKARAKPTTPKPTATPPKTPAPEPTAKAPAKKAATRRPPGAPIQRTRVVIAMDVYEPNKDTIKAPFKEHELKWTFLGEGKGLYKRADNGVHCFTQFKDDGVHYSIWGDDKARVEKILDAWRAFLGEEGWTKATTSGEEAVAAEKQQGESEAMRLWRLAEPQARPGEPDFFLKKRVAEWQAKKPA